MIVVQLIVDHKLYWAPFNHQSFRVEVQSNRFIDEACLVFYLWRNLLNFPHSCACALWTESGKDALQIFETRRRVGCRCQKEREQNFAMNLTKSVYKLNSRCCLVSMPFWECSATSWCKMYKLINWITDKICLAINQLLSEYYAMSLRLQKPKV